MFLVLCCVTCCSFLVCSFPNCFIVSDLIKNHNNKLPYDGMIAKNSSYPRKKKKYFGCSIAICLIVDKKGGGGGGSNSSALQQQFNFKYQTLLTNCIE